MTTSSQHGGPRPGAGRIQQWLHLDLEHARTLRLLVLLRSGSVPEATPETIVCEMIDAVWREQEDAMAVVRDVEYWRVAVLDVITTNLSQQATAGHLSPVEYRQLYTKVADARRRRDAEGDHELHDLMREYAPTDPHLANYPG